MAFDIVSANLPDYFGATTATEEGGANEFAALDLLASASLTLRLVGVVDQSVAVRALDGSAVDRV